MLEAKNAKLSVVVTAALFIAFACADYATPQIMNALRGDDYQWLVALALGICIAQVTLIAVWAVFAPGNIVVRLPWALLLGLMMWYFLAFSQQQVSQYNGRGIAELGIGLLVGVAVLQIPLWIAKQAFRYRMLSPGETALPTSSERVQFELKHMLIGTLLFAIALSPLRLVIPNGTSVTLRLDREEPYLIGAAIAVSLVATLPCLWGGFVSNARAVSLGIGWLLYDLAVTGLEFSFFWLTLGSPEPRPIEEFFLVYLVNASQGAVVFGVMRAYRALGYRLQRVPRDMPTAESIASAWEKVLIEVEPIPDINQKEDS